MLAFLLSTLLAVSAPAAQLRPTGARPLKKATAIPPPPTPSALPTTSAWTRPTPK
ncbi:hypothetical protein [Hymenobacter cellulosilyticus]|uniref:Uncharacterized protein n=1 Tax=Hymenobacter cellulosilyticus TaxID=2932248 RepID=A0A8T9Q486_9BACT|nr:hypothetical protein [Hymenobacter cellulosilyticus]UOQ70708.1 hypothetical protein MUN79_18670 [Hymenobacter cellulosilyticus]